MNLFIWTVGSMIQSFIGGLEGSQRVRRNSAVVFYVQQDFFPCKSKCFIYIWPHFQLRTYWWNSIMKDYSRMARNNPAVNEMRVISQEKNAMLSSRTSSSLYALLRITDLRENSWLHNMPVSWTKLITDHFNKCEPNWISKFSLDRKGITFQSSESIK